MKRRIHSRRCPGPERAARRSRAAAFAIIALGGAVGPVAWAADGSAQES